MKNKKGCRFRYPSATMVLKLVYSALASFTCPRTITFMDWRLGFTHKALVVAIIAWVCYNLFKSQLFLMDSLPLGLVSVWATPTYNGSLGFSSFPEARDGFYEDSKKSVGTASSYCSERVHEQLMSPPYCTNTAVESD